MERTMAFVRLGIFKITFGVGVAFVGVLVEGVVVAAVVV